jgi:chromosome segregation ATPase
VSALSLRLSTAQTLVAIGGDAGQAIEAAVARMAGELRAELQENIDHLSRRIAYVEQGSVGGSAAPDEISRIESAIDRVRRDLRELHENMAADFQEFEIKLNTQASAIESSRTAMAQTDDLVERVVEALDSLQSSLPRKSEDRLMAIG